MPERVGESPAERVGPSRPTPHRPSRPSSAPSTDLRRPRPLNVHAIPPLPLCGFSVDESIGRSTPHCRALGTVGDSAEGPIGCAPGCVVKARPMDRRRFGHRGWANGRGVGPSPQPGVDRRHSSSSADAAPIRWATRGGIPVGDYTPSYVPSRSLTLRHTNRTKGDRTAPR